MVALLPGLIALGSMLFLRLRLGVSTVLAIGLSILGAIVIVLRPDREASFTGDALVLLSLPAGVAWVLFTERYLSALPPVEMTAAVIAHGTQLTQVYPMRATLAAAASGVLSTGGRRRIVERRAAARRFGPRRRVHQSRAAGRRDLRRGAMLVQRT